MSSKVWGWRGRRFDEGDGEGKGRKKMEEVGRRLSVGVVSLSLRSDLVRGEEREKEEQKRAESDSRFGLAFAFILNRSKLSREKRTRS